MKAYELASRDIKIPLHHTSARFYWEKLFASLPHNHKDIQSLFTQIKDKAYQKDLFKKFVGIFNLETSGFCNRKCSYCPVSFTQRHDKNNLIKQAIFHKFLENLEEVEFSSSISLNLYNEPLLDPYICSHIKDLRKSCPKSFIGFNSNGDFLTTTLLESLQNAGLNRLNITLHTLPNETYDDNKSSQKITRFYRQLGLSVPEIISIPNHSQKSEIRLDSLTLYVNCVNWGEFGSDRGGGITTFEYR